jgi:ABC-type cobalamin transport system permease subunit
VLVPAGGLVAAAILPAADLIAERTAFSLPGVAGAAGLPVGAVVAPLSVPILLWLLDTRRSTVR